MTDDIKDDELEDGVAANAEPNFSPNITSPVLDDDVVDDDPHASFNPVAAVEEDPYIDPYGVGAPKVGNDEDYEDDEEEEVLSLDGDSEAY